MSHFPVRESGPPPAMAFTTRRALLKGGGVLGTVAALAAPLAMLPPAAATVADPVFAAIEAHKAARVRLSALVSTDDAFDDAVDDEWRCWLAVCACIPDDLDALMRYVRHTATYPDLGSYGDLGGAGPILVNVAASMRALIVRGVLPVSPACFSIGEGV
ncbi:MAG: hypothetical protein J0I31_03150 [Rhizobiales bacterium]|nr:hypothetical protein [Hyphomicrobiales bacterium]